MGDGREMDDTGNAAGRDQASTPGTQRLDKWLWFARVVKTRTQAAALVTETGVRINGAKVDRPAHLIRPGDTLTIVVHGRVRILEVSAPGTRRGGAPDAARLFRDLTPPPPPRADVPPPAGGDRDPGSGRPTKRDRRLTEKLRGRE